MAEEVRHQLHAQAETLSRKDAIHKVLKQGALLAVAANLAEGMELVNRFAPEHFELLVREPRRWVQQVRAAGAVFAGPWTPESAGDFVAGPSHVLPTGGAAALFSGLTVQDFRRKISVVSLTQADLKEMLPTIEAFGRIEGLDAHVRSAQLRFRNR
jgi:histidinol dehydrogenase